MLRYRSIGMLLRTAVVMVGLLPALSSADEVISAPVERFPIHRFEIEGNTLLPRAELESLVAEFSGPQREFGDIQRALETIENAYRRRGYAAVQVLAPEQELTGGVVRLVVHETVLGKVKIQSEPKYFDAANLRAGLPALHEGTTPNALDLSAQIALNNENPAKQIEVVLGVADTAGQVDAKLKLAESDPRKVTLFLDNTGTDETGRHRIGVALQHANLWNSDHVVTVAYQTSPEEPESVNIYSMSYRVPVYDWAGSFDVILAKSTVASATTATTAGPLAFAGSGSYFGLRYTQALPRHGDTLQKVILGWEIKATDNSCSLGDFGTAGCGSAGADVTLRPISLGYSRMMVAPGSAIELTLGVSANLPGGSKGSDADFQAARPSPTGGTGARAHYSLLKGGLTQLQVLDGDWQLRFAANAQWTGKALLAQEQMGLAGSNAVRGFSERAVTRDTGLLVNVEAYTPNFGNPLGLSGSLRALAFLDAASGRNQLLAGEEQPKHSLSSWGFGFRYGIDNNLSAKLDVAQVIRSPIDATRQGDWLGHFSVTLAF